MSLLDIPEPDLLSGARRLDRNALEALHDRYYPQVYRYVYFRLGEGQSSAQITAQVFIHLLEALGKRRGPHKNLESWLFSQAAQLVDDQYQTPAVQGYQSLIARAASQQSADADADDYSRAYRQILFVQRAIADLSPDEQHFLALRFSQPRSLGEVADLMGKSLRSMRVLQERTLKSFGSAFGGEI